MRKALKATAVMAVVAMLAAAGFAETAVARGMGGKAGRGMRMGMQMGGAGGMGIQRLLNNPEAVEEIWLTDTQVDRLREISTGSQRESIRTRSEVQLLQLDLKSLLQQDNPDIKKIDSLIDNISAKQAEMKKSRIHSMLEMKDVLTDEQQDKLKEYIATKMKERRSGNRSGRGKGGRNRGGGSGAGMGGWNSQAPDLD